MHLTPLLLGLSCGLAVSVVAIRQSTPPLPLPVANGTVPDGSNVTAYFFDQLIDHSNPSLGTFKQRYYFNDTFFSFQGSPIVISSAGEGSADIYNTTLTLPNSLQYALMKSLGAAGVLLEHRYWGLSSPFQNLTTENLKYLTLNQSIEDIQYFAEKALLPWRPLESGPPWGSHPEHTPWISLGCSYPGLLAAFNQRKYPDKFAAAWATSAPVQAQSDFWQYFEPIEEGMPKNCSRDAALVIRAIDEVFHNGKEENKAAMKNAFGLGNLTDDDFGYIISLPLWNWEYMRPWSSKYQGQNAFFKWCDSIQTFSNGTVNTSPEGVGLQQAITGYTTFIKSHIPCQGGACYSTYNYSRPFYTDQTADNSLRQWMWLDCNELGWWQNGSPGNYSSIMSSLITSEYYLRQCNHLFPNADGTPGNFNPNTTGTNTVYGGWNLSAQNLYVVNGQYDPWRSVSLSSIWAPPQPPSQTIEVLAGGHHCWDWNLSGAYYNPDVKRVVDLGIDTLRGWLEAWYAARPNITNSLPVPKPDVWVGIPQ